MNYPALKTKNSIRSRGDSEMRLSDDSQAVSPTEECGLFDNESIGRCTNTTEYCCPVSGCKKHGFLSPGKNKKSFLSSLT